MPTQEPVQGDGKAKLVDSSAALAATYDAFPYESYSFPLCRPDHLATIATLFGMTPAAPDRARVLELGCGGGNNIIPLAEQYPDCQFVGIDLSSRQIQEGLAAAEPLGLRNLTLQQGDILAIGAELGTFDYIIAHGLFSWVPTRVQEKILSLCGKLLQPHGVAYISYNTYPGWHMREIIRNAMLFGTRGMSDPRQRISAAISILEFAAQSAPPSAASYAAFLAHETDLLKRQHPSYLLHDYLEIDNIPVYFHDFADRASRHGLHYLSDAEPSMMPKGAVTPAFTNSVTRFATDRIAVEQYLDIAMNRMFRSSLLCREKPAGNEDPPAARFASMRVASRGRPVTPIKPGSAEPVTFRWPKSTLSTTDRLFIETYLLLAQRWPESIPVPELFTLAKSRIAPGMEPQAAPAAGDSLILRGFWAGQLEFFALPDCFTNAVSARPIAAASARLAARRSTAVTNRRHEMVRLDELQRFVLGLLDGNHDRDAIIRNAVYAIGRGELALQGSPRPTIDPSQVRKKVQASIEPILISLANSMLLIG